MKARKAIDLEPGTVFKVKDAPGDGLAVQLQFVKLFGPSTDLGIPVLNVATWTAAVLDEDTSVIVLQRRAAILKQK